MSRNRSKSAFFQGGWVTLSADFRGKEAWPTYQSWYQSSRVIALSCGIKISAVCHLVLSQSTCVTDGQTDRQNYDSQDRPRTCSRGSKTLKLFQCFISHITTSEIISKLFQQLKLFQNNFRGSLQLMNIFQHVQCR